MIIDWKKKFITISVGLCFHVRPQMPCYKMRWFLLLYGHGPYALKGKKVSSADFWRILGTMNELNQMKILPCFLSSFLLMNKNAFFRFSVFFPTLPRMIKRVRKLTWLICRIITFKKKGIKFLALVSFCFVFYIFWGLAPTWFWHQFTSSESSLHHKQKSTHSWSSQSHFPSVST